MIARKGSRAQKSLGGNELVWGCPAIAIFPYKVGPFFRPKTPLHADLEIFRFRPCTDPSATHPTLLDAALAHPGPRSGQSTATRRPWVRVYGGMDRGRLGFILMDTRIYRCIMRIYMYIYPHPHYMHPWTYPPRHRCRAGAVTCTCPSKRLGQTLAGNQVGQSPQPGRTTTNWRPTYPPVTFPPGGTLPGPTPECWTRT